MNQSHQLHETRSLRMHRLIVETYLADPKSVIRFARENLSRWQNANLDCDDFAVWEKILSGNQAGIIEALTARDEQSVRLRQSSPFAGLVSTEDRSRIFALAE